MSKLVLSAIAAAALAGSAYTLAATAATDAPEAPRRTGWRAGPTRESPASCSTRNSPA